MLHALHYSRYTRAELPAYGNYKLLTISDG